MVSKNKFRAWNIEKRIMCYDREDGYACDWDGTFASEVGLINMYLNLDDSIKEYEYMQFIGKTDVNGREIYEGDIVKLHQFLFDGDEYEKEIIVSIEYMDDMACFGANLLQAEEIRRYMGYTEEDTEKSVVPLNNFYGLHEGSFEVIGNIYENEYLLERT